MRRTENSLLSIFAAPIAIALLSMIGLIAALVGDGVFDFLSWIGLTGPVVAVIAAIVARRR